MEIKPIVSKIFIHPKEETEDLYTFTRDIKGKHLALPKITANHAIYDKPSNGHLQAKEFAIGDVFTDINGVTAPIVAIDIHHHALLPADYKVYNFEVTPHHTFHIGVPEFWLRVHNGGGSKGDPRQSIEAPNTLKSGTIVSVLEVLSEGEIEGIIGGFQGTYLNQIPIENEDGIPNFTGITGDTRNGTPSQLYIKGYEEISAVFGANDVITK